MPESIPLVSLLCHVAPESISNRLRSLLGKLCLTDESDGGGTLTIKAAFHKPPLTLRFTITPYPDLPRTAHLSISCTPGAWIRFLGTGVNVIADIHIFLVVLNMAYSFLFHPDHTLFLDSPITPVVIFSLAWIPVVMLLRQRYFVNAEGVTQFVEAIIDELNKDCLIEPLSPLTIRLSSGKGLNIFPILFEAAKVLLAVFLFGYCWGAALVILFKIKGMFQSFVNRFRSQWRGVFLSYYDLYASCCGDVLFIVLLGVVFTATIFNLSGFAFPALRSNPLFDRTLALDETGYAAHFMVNSSVLSSHAPEIVRYISSEFRRMQPHDVDEENRAFLSAVAMINVSILLWMVLILVFIPLDLKRHFLKFKKTLPSKTNADETMPVFNPPSPDEPLSSIRERVTFAVFIGGMSLFHWFAALASLDILYYLWTGSETLWGVLDISLNYQKTTCQLIGGTGGLAIFVVAHLLLSLPGAILLFILMYRIAAFCLSEGKFLFLNERPPNSSLKHEIQPFLTCVCQDYGISVPQIRAVNSGPCVLYSQSFLWGLDPRIIVHESILDASSLDEIKALIAHELYHVKNDVEKIARFRLLSTVLLFPFNILMMTHDYALREWEADDFAIKATGQRESLIQAVFNLMELNETRYEKPRIQKRESILMRIKSWASKNFRFVFYFHSNALIGAAYPLQKERLTRMMAVSPKPSER